MLRAGVGEPRKGPQGGGGPAKPRVCSARCCAPIAAALLANLATHGRCAAEAIFARVGHRKLALPKVGIVLASWLQLVAPGEESVGRDTGVSQPDTQVQASGLGSRVGVQ